MHVTPILLGILFILLTWAPVGYIAGIIQIACGYGSHPSQDDMEKAVATGYLALFVALMALGSSLYAAILGLKANREVNKFGVRVGVWLRYYLDAEYRYRIQLRETRDHTKAWLGEDELPSYPQHEADLG